MRTVARGCVTSVVTLAALAVFDIVAAHAQAVGVIQVPRFNFFSVQTTVSVPDSGGAYLGGIGRSSTHRSQRGLPLVGRDPLFGGRAVGRTSSATGVSVHAQIHDHQEMDEALLRQAGGLHATGWGAASSQVRREPVKSVAQIRRDQAAAAEAAGDEAERYLERGREALAEGKTGVARVYLQMALRRAQGKTRSEALSALARLQPASVVAQRKPAVTRPE
jgi:hypothetical protein